MKFLIFFSLLFSISAVQAMDCTKQIEKQIKRMDQGTIFDFEYAEEQPEDKTLQTFRIAIACKDDHREGVNVYDVTINERCSVINVEVYLSPRCN